MTTYRNPTFESDQDRKFGEESFVATLFFVGAGGGDIETRQDISFNWQEVEQPGTIDIEFDSIYDKFEKYPENFPCGAPDDLDEQITNEIELWVKDHLPGYVIRTCKAKELTL